MVHPERWRNGGVEPTEGKSKDVTRGVVGARTTRVRACRWMLHERKPAMKIASRTERLIG